MRSRLMFAALAITLCLPGAAWGQGAPTPPALPGDMAAPAAPAGEDAPVMGGAANNAPAPAAVDAGDAPAPAASAATLVDDAEGAVPPPALPRAEDEPAAAAPTGMFGWLEAALAAHAGGEHDLSPIGMFLAADVIVKGVMVLLALLSALAWAAWLLRLFALALGRRALRRGYMALDAAGSLPPAMPVAGRGDAPVARMIRAAAAELERSSAPGFPAAGVKDRAASHMARIEAAAARRMQAGAGLLASIGSTAPFIGLFGTVWGIMNSFIGIAGSGTTNLAVVAPGIAEALLATAMGLVAAIPATLFYNQLSRANGAYRAMLADAAALVERTLSRDLDRPASAQSLFAAE